MSMPGAVEQTPLPILTPYRSFDDIIDSLATLEWTFYTRQDRRAVFVTTYLTMTRELQCRVNDRFFLDNAWVTAYAIAFANYYRQALVAFEQQDLAAVPKSWRIAFMTSAHGDGLVLHDMLLGINAHVNGDLPLALRTISIEPDRSQRYRDHAAINQVLHEVAGLVKDRVCAMYGPVWSLLDHGLGPLDESVTAFSFQRARESSWAHAVALADARDEPEVLAIRTRIDEIAAFLARLILAPSPHVPVLQAAARHLERITPWWMYITLPEVTRGRPAASVVEAPVVQSLDALIVRLQEIVDRYDRAHSMMAVYPAVAVLVTRRVQRAVTDGATFEDGAWLTNLELQLASHYLQALARFESGQLDLVPRCWVTAFEAMNQGHTTILQALVVALNARLNHDLGIALQQSEVLASMDRCERDLNRLHGFVGEEFARTQELLTQRYSEVFKVLDLLAGSLERLIADFNYLRARDAAWENGLVLARAASQEERQTLMQEMDQRATALAQKILLQGLPGSSWVIEAVRHIETAFERQPSAWIQPAGTQP